MTDSIIQVIRSHNTNTAESALSDLAYAVQGLRKVQTMTPDQRQRAATMVRQINGILAEGELM